MTGHTIVVNSLSKSHAMTGARLGWTVAPREATARLADLAIATNYGLPGFIQAGGAVALTDAEEAERAVIARYRDRRAAVLEALRAVPGIGVVPPEGGMYVMLDIRPTGLSGTAFAERLLDAERVAVMPGESFGAAGAGHVRVALTVPEASLREAVARIGRFAGTLS
jgi:arginine:pyruvate transaminase